MEDLHSDSLPAAMEGSTSSASPEGAMMEASTSASPQVAPIPSRITGIGEGEIQRLIRDLEGLSSSIGELKQGLERLRSPLVALSESEDPSNRITAKCWTKQVRKICYDSGDYLYDFMHSGNEFKLLGARALDARRRLEWCGIQPQTSSTSTARHLPAAPRADLIDLGHMVDEVNNLIGNQKELKVVSIVGPEGVGKTTLAKRLYQSVGGNGRFDFRAFLRASPKPDIRRLLTSMFTQIQRKRPSCRLNAYQLIDSIATYLQNKRYFIVIDDLWTAAVWEIISRAFPDGDCGSRIITTTQTKGVALACCGYQSKYVFMMEPLTDAQSENLFFRTVFGSESGCPWHLEEVSREIIRKCGGLPLAIINIASMLPSGLNSEELKSIRDSLPYTPRTNPTPEWMKEVVNLLYSTLRPHLKTCLLYFSMYPEGCIVRKGDLVKQWVVEGFLDGVQGQATEEIARGYFDELVRRGMIQPVDIKNGEVLSCTLHHMIHDVIVNKSMEENFVIIANYFQSAIPLPDKVRRLSVQFGVAKSAHIPESIIVSELRSLAFSGFFQCLRSIAKYRHLRVLILDIWADEDEDAFDLTGIRELLRLRYLKIACNIAVKLPDEIQQQQYLEMLDVDATVVAIPWDIGGLTRLSSIKIAVRELLCKDIYFLQILPALTALSVHVKTPPTETIVLDKGGFLNLKFFTFRCSAPHLLIKEKAMPKIEKLNLCFNAHEARQDGKKPIIIEHLATLKEISVKIGGAAADVDSALANAVTNDPKNPRLQLIESREDEEHGTLEEQDEIMEKDAHEYSGKQDGGSGRCEIMGEDRDDTYGIQDDGSGNDEHNETDSREGLDDTYGIQDDGARKDEHREADSRVGLDDTYEIQDDVTRKDEHKEADSSKLKYKEGLDDTYGIQDDGPQKVEHKGADSREMEVALGSAASLLVKVLTTLSDGLVAAYMDSIQLGHNSQQIRDKLLHTQGLLHNAHGSHVGDNPGLQRLLEKLSRDADQAEDLLDEVHYFQIHDKLHGTTYATTQDLDGHQTLHARSALRHTLSTLLHCFSCSPTPKRDGSDDAAAAVAGVTNSNSATADDGDTLHFDRVSMSSKIKSVLQGVQSHCDSVSNLLGSIPSNTTALAVILHRPPTASMIIQDTLYGRKGIFEETVNRITTVTGATHTVSILPIVGPGGIGKTTFAQHLYNDARTQEHFQVRVWVCVSTEFDVVKLAREILACIPATEEGGSSGVANETTNLDHLQRSIAHRLKSKRFLIVLDDIWKCDDEDQWKTLLAPFTKGEAKGSMVLVTTRFPKLAQMMETVGSLELAGLESNDFFTFFEACMFGEDDKPEKYEDELAGIARRIANKLKGSPLAAKTVGRLLHKDLSQKHWNGVLEKHEWLKQQNNHDIMTSLKISYDCLPFDLKKCFSYCGLFPEDHMFTSSEINHFWVAMGIIDSNHQDDRNYLEELVDSGFLMKKFSYRRDRYCYVMHDLMHELSKSVSAQECLNISGLDFRADAIPQSVRHLSINIEDRYDANFEKEMCKLRERIDIANLWTLMIFRGYEEERVVKILKDTFKEINSLRVLFIVVKSAQSFPDRFSKLIHLQYLKIRSAYRDREMTLPSTLSRFYHLKFLDLDGWRGSSDLPENFSHLENLHDFHAESELHSNIRNVGKMKHLQELKEFHVRKGSMGFELTELGALTELEGGLIIRGLEHVATKEEATAAKLKLKKNLKELELLWGRDGPTTDADILDALQPHSNLRVLTIANHGGTVGPSWLCLDIWLTSLERLTVEGISWSTLPPFAKLPNLKRLKLKKISGMHQFGLRCGGAPGKCSMRLKTVEFYEMPELAEWAVEPNCHSFTSIEEIICIDCPNLCVMPFSEVSCTNLRRLQVSGCPKMSLPSMPHTSTLKILDVKRGGRGYSETLLSYDGKKLVVRGYGSALAYHNLDKVEDMAIANVSGISLTDIEKLKSLTELTVGRCDGLFPEELDGSIVFRSVKSLILDVSHLTSSKSSSSKVLNCFPALSVLVIHGDEECVMQFPSSSSLQDLTFKFCMGLVLVPVENGGGIQEDKSLLQSLSIFRCGELFCRWPMGESESIYPFPASLKKLYVLGEPSMKSIAVLSNLTSLTSLSLLECSNLTVDGFNPLIVVNLIQLQVRGCNTLAVDMLSEVASQRAKLLPAGYISRLEKLTVDDISGLLVTPICNLLAPALHTLEFLCDERMESFTEEQEKALQLLTSLQKLIFFRCEDLQSLPQGLHRLSSLKELRVIDCPKIRSMPNEGLPVSLRKLVMNRRSAEIKEQIEKIKRSNPDLSVTDKYTED